MASKKDETTPEHTEGGATTKDAQDVGVPMLAGDPSEPVGPEDALGDGPKRGDYSERIGDANYHPHAGTDAQRPKAGDRGDAKGRKGGVTTA